MTIGLLFVVALVVLVVVFAAWNLVPSLRARFTSWTTVLEGIGMLVYEIMDKITNGLQDAVAAGYLPPWLIGWLPIIMTAWFLYKRFFTSTPVGQKP